MATNERLKARLLTEEEKATAPPGPTPPPAKSASSSTDPAPVDKDYLPGGQDDLSYVFKRVVFRLHETYPTPNRVCDKMPYKVTETGWGEFTVQIKITFVPEAGEKTITLQHPIKLHHWGEPIEAPPPRPAGEETPADTPAEKTDDDVKMETSTPAAAEPEAADTPAEPSQVPTETETPAETPADTPVAAPVLPTVPTVASTYSVHAWQYDEVVFSDPPANFMAILEQHPPTPLPARPRRARDQREEHELKTGKKRAKSARPSMSRAGTEVEGGTRAGTPVTPAPGPATVGVAGELGSADVPLEFTSEMEKGEANRLTEVRVEIVKEMDRWRERLIAQEKELARLKEEMRA